MMLTGYKELCYQSPSSPCSPLRCGRTRDMKPTALRWLKPRD